MKTVQRYAISVLAASALIGFSVKACKSVSTPTEPACVDFVREQVGFLHSFGRLVSPSQLPGGGVISIAFTPAAVKGFAFMPEHVLRHNFSLLPGFVVTKTGACWVEGLKYVTLQFEGPNNHGSGT